MYLVSAINKVTNLEDATNKRHKDNEINYISTYIILNGGRLEINDMNQKLIVHSRKPI